MIYFVTIRKHLKN